MVNKRVLDLSDKGLILIGGTTNRSGRLPNSYCPLCEESFENVTDMPLGIPFDDPDIQDIASQQ